MIQPSDTSASGRKLYASRKKWLGVLAGSLIFTVVGLLIGESGNLFGILSATFFGLCTVVAFATLVRPPTLTIDRHGFTSDHFWRHDRFEFVRCGDFRSWSNPTTRWQRLVVFDYEGLGEHAPLQRMSRRLSGANAALPDTFGLSADALADLLNRARLAAQE